MRHALHTAALLLALCTLAACTDEESDLGATLMGGDAIYNGKSYTMYADTAYSLRDDSLQTAGLTKIVIGNYTDATFGKVSAQFFTQITLPSTNQNIDFGAVEIDSVVLSLAIDSIFPDTSLTYNLHFEVAHLAEALSADSTYYSFSSIPVDAAGTLFNEAKQVKGSDKVVNLVLGGEINSILSLIADRDEFATLTKGLRISIVAASSDEGMVTVDLSQTATRIRAHYRYGNDTAYYDFSVSNGVHFSHFEHDYSGTVVNGQARMDGGSRLYLEPLAGYNAMVSFDRALRAFHEEHPLAVVHRAELVLPVATEAPAKAPHRLLAVTGKRYITDYLSAGVDGYYDNGNKRYRLRIPLHLQEMFRNGFDNGTKMLIDSRSSVVTRTILNGYNETDRPRIELEYTE